MAVPRTKTGVRALLGAHGIHPRRLRGQNFLVDGNLIDAIVRDAGVGSQDAVLEIGTGTGILTDALAERAGAVVSVDIDGELQALTRALREWPASVRFVTADILAGKRKLNPAVIDLWGGAGAGLRPRVVSNLPYAIATPVVACLLFEGIPLVDATLLVQREAAERMTAPVGARAYGPLAIAVALLAEARTLRAVPPQVFWPEPKVESALVRLAPRDPELGRRLAREGFPDRLLQAFGQRRKALRRLFGPDRLAAEGLSPDVRPQELTPKQWLALLTVPRR